MVYPLLSSSFIYTVLASLDSYASNFCGSHCLSCALEVTFSSTHTVNTNAKLGTDCQPSVSALSFQLAQRPVALPSSRWSIVLCVAGDVNGGCIKFVQVYEWSSLGAASRRWLCWTRLQKHTCYTNNSQRDSHFLSSSEWRNCRSRSNMSNLWWVLLGSPFQRISFLSLEIMSMAMRTFKAS
jgi:hypothetical protein